MIFPQKDSGTDRSHDISDSLGMAGTLAILTWFSVVFFSPFSRQQSLQNSCPSVTNHRIIHCSAITTGYAAAVALSGK